MSLLSYIETVSDGDSPSGFGCSIDNGQATAMYLLSNVTDPSIFETAIAEVLGRVGLAPRSPFLERILPIQHPYLPFFASAIAGMKGFGAPWQSMTSTNNAFFPQVASYPLFPQYHLAVNFAPRPYPVLPDILCNNPQTAIWTLPDGVTSEPFTYYPEYERFCYPTIEPSADAVSVQVGQMAFNADGLAEDSKPFLSMPRKFLNNSMFTVHWMQVPLSYVTSSNSYLQRFRGTVNQLPFNSTNLGIFEAGQLLYLGYKINIITPPWALNLVIQDNGVPTLQRFCNLDLIFMYTNRELGADPAFPSANDNVVAAHHNLNPYFGSGGDALSDTFLYTSTVPTSGASSKPQWASSPIPHILWSNPDAFNAITPP